jgi:ATP-dependent Zn protease
MNLTIENLAYHEAGHAVVLLAFQFPVEAITIDREFYTDTPVIAKILSQLPLLTVEEKRKKVKQKIISIYAGVESEYILLGLDPSHKSIYERIDEGLAIELSLAYKILPEGGIDRPGDETHVEFLNRFRIEARRILVQNWGVVQALAEELLTKRTLAGDEVDSIYYRSIVMQK